ncbi:hypothetical protein EU245_03785 [Lentibacillus lipolyticus]|nr:hypothetical protein EU245_03785 [Lentibacillus lipolyticus]
MKKAMQRFIPICVILFLSLYLFYGHEDAELVNEKTKEIHKGDFIMHIRVEQADEGFRVFRSVQYTGKEMVKVEHQTPLISVSFKYADHDYTGSTVSKTLRQGSSYHPQDPKMFKAPDEEGKHTLYCETIFTAGGEEITIRHEETLVFE